MEHERQFTTMEHAALTDASDLTLLQAAALLSGSSAWDSRPIPAANVPSFVMSDGPHGVRRQLGDLLPDGLRARGDLGSRPGA